MLARHINRFFHLGRNVYANEKSALATLRKKTGYTFVNCKKALEANSNDLNKVCFRLVLVIYSTEPTYNVLTTLLSQLSRLLIRIKLNRNSVNFGEINRFSTNFTQVLRWLLNTGLATGRQVDTNWKHCYFRPKLGWKSKPKPWDGQKQQNLKADQQDKAWSEF